MKTKSKSNKTKARNMKNSQKLGKEKQKDCHQKQAPQKANLIINLRTPILKKQQRQTNSEQTLECSPELDYDHLFADFDPINHKVIAIKETKTLRGRTICSNPIQKESDFGSFLVDSENNNCQQSIFM